MIIMIIIKMMVMAMMAMLVTCLLSCPCFPPSKVKKRLPHPPALFAGLYLGEIVGCYLCWFTPDHDYDDHYGDDGGTIINTSTKKVPCLAFSLLQHFHPDHHLPEGLKKNQFPGGSKKVF